MDDLSAALGINKPSLYAAFGGKEELFLQVVDHYREKMLSPLTSKLSEAESLRDGLSQFFRGIAGVVMENDTPPGCLIACLLSEECCESEAIKAKLSGSIDGGDEFFRRVFEKHRNELNPNLSPEAAAILMVSTLHGLSIRARAGGSKESLSSGAAAFMKAVLK